MQTKKSLPASLAILTLVCLGALLFTGFAPIYGQVLARQVQQGPVNLPVDPIAQSLSASCGEAAITMTYNYAYPQAQVSEQAVIEYAAAQGYYTEELEPFTSPANMVNIARYYAEKVSTGAALTSDLGLGLLYQRLQNGEPVIIDVLSRLNDPASEAHFVVVTGISVDPNRENAVIIHYNDPLTGQNESADWAGDEGIWHAWQKNGDPGGSGWWLVISPSR